jgi:hypothetical protein
VARRAREDAISVVFRDLLLLLALLMLTLVVLLVPLIKMPRETAQPDKPAGDLLAELVWSPESTADIDIWAEAPNGERVGYLRPRGVIFNLVRDDLGREGDFSGLNYEFVFSRGIPDGRYRFSVVYYAANEQGARPEEVRVSIRYRTGRRMRVIWEGRLTLDYPGQEKALVAFVMRNGRLVPGSLDFAPFSIFRKVLAEMGEPYAGGKP